MQECGGDDSPTLLGHEDLPLGHPRVDDELSRLSFELVEYRVYRDRTTGENRRNVGVDEASDLLAIGAAKLTDDEGIHGWPPWRITTTRMDRRIGCEGRYQCGTVKMVIGVNR